LKDFVSEVGRNQEERNPNEKLRVSCASVLPKLGSLRKPGE
jgi:hypothetical protein